MKLFVIFFFSTFPLFAQSSPEPAELTKLRVSWSSAKAEAVKPLDVKYASALTAMKERFTKAGNLDAAIAVDKELKAVLAAAEVTLKAQQDSPTHIGEWQWGQDHRLRFHANGTFVERKKSGEPVTSGNWESELDGTITLRCENGYSVVVTLGPKPGTGTGACTSPSGQKHNVSMTKIERSQK
jgi:hypothetical protein